MQGGVLTQSEAGGVRLVFPTDLVARIKEAVARIPHREDDKQQLYAALDANSHLAATWLDQLCMRTYGPDVIVKILDKPDGAEALKSAAQAQLQLMDLTLEVKRIIGEWTECSFALDG